MAEISITQGNISQLTQILSQKLKMKPAQAQALLADGKLTSTELWDARDKMRAFPSLSSLKNTAAVGKHGFWSEKYIQSKLGLNKGFYNQLFRVLENAAEGKGSDQSSLDDLSEVNIFRESLQQFISTRHDEIMKKMQAAFKASAKKITKKSTGHYHLYARAIDLDAVFGLSKTTLRALNGLTLRQAKQIRPDMSYLLLKNLLGNQVTADEYHILTKMKPEDLTTFARLPKSIVATIKPQDEKTKRDVLLFLELASPTPAEDVVRILFDYYAAGKPHPIFKNIKYQKSTADGRMVLHLKLENKAPFYSDRVVYMTYKKTTQKTAGGLQISHIAIQQVQGPSFGLPSLDTDKYAAMITMAGAMTVREIREKGAPQGSLGGSVMVLANIGNPDMPDLMGLVDYVLRQSLEGKFKLLAGQAAELSAKNVFAQCIVDEFTQESTRCRLEDDAK